MKRWQRTKFALEFGGWGIVFLAMVALFVTHDLALLSIVLAGMLLILTSRWIP